MSRRSLRVERDGPITVLTLDRPRERNALTPELAGQLLAALAAADDDPGTRAVVLTGSGDTFSVGADLAAGERAVEAVIANDVEGHTEDGYREPAGRITAQIRSLSIPVIAAVNGDAVGGGATILLGADARFAADDARFGFVFTRRGVNPEGGSTWLLPRLVGLGVATDWLISGRVIPAEHALAAGLVTALRPREDVLDAALDYARQLARATDRDAVAAVRRLLAASDAAALDAAMLAESTTLTRLAGTAAAREGIRSFLERRPPRFG